MTECSLTEDRKRVPHLKIGNIINWSQKGRKKKVIIQHTSIFLENTVVYLLSYFKNFVNLISHVWSHQLINNNRCSCTSLWNDMYWKERHEKSIFFFFKLKGFNCHGDSNPKSFISSKNILIKRINTFCLYKS